MKIVVTGSAGFVGSHIAAKYRALGHEVVEVDIRGKKPKDICDARAMEKLFLREKPDIVSHHAGVIEVVKSIADPEPTFRTNVLGTVNLLQAAGMAGTVKRFIFPSSYTVYGEPRKLPVNEVTLIAPISPYGLSKTMAEEAIRFYGNLYGFAHMIFRYPNIYGPGQDGTGAVGAVAIFAELMKRGKAPVIFGDGSKTRDYVHIEDIVRLNALALRTKESGTFCIGTSREMSDLDVFVKIAKHMAFPDSPVHAPHRHGEVRNIAVSGAKAERLLKFAPRISFERGVQEYMKKCQGGMA